MAQEPVLDLYAAIRCKICNIIIQTHDQGFADVETQKREFLKKLQKAIDNDLSWPAGTKAENTLNFQDARFVLIESYSLAQFNNMNGEQLCRGQGVCYTQRFERYNTPSSVNHSKFRLRYADRCCYCAKFLDWPMSAFLKIGCYLCKEQLMPCLTFKYIKKSTTFWSNLPESAFDIIMQFLVLRKERKTIQMAW